MWIGTVLFGGAFALSLVTQFDQRLGNQAADVALLGTAFEAVLEPVPRTRSRAAALATLVLGILAQVSHFPILHVLAYAAGGWLALEVRRPLERSPWPILAATAFAMTHSPLVFGPVFAVTAFSARSRGALLGRAAPLAKRARDARRRVPGDRDGDDGAWASDRAPHRVRPLLRRRVPQWECASVAPFRIAVHGAVLAQVFACFSHDFTRSNFAAGCAVVLEATAIVGIAMFLPKNARYVVALTLAGLFLGCGGFLEMTIPILFSPVGRVSAPSVVFVVRSG